MTVKAEQLAEIFTHHPPLADNIEQYLAIREAGQRLAETILAHTPVCGDQQAAIRKVREAVMTANAALALKGLV